ncbi:hypothetical protein OIU77_008843 [Salix suchowensis]|uniref:S-locus glycoprotein domain-containing protein n=1 Tax=Salix suchowensis TaxID=1278906 RepID=A0ABQ9ACU4_9ROSI|nr:hypothetical protein OIU77_008843 [Salix suchowensis]
MESLPFFIFVITLFIPSLHFLSFAADIITSDLPVKDGQTIISKSEWATIYSVPVDTCENYRQCGDNAICRVRKSPICECLQGYRSIPEEELDIQNFYGSRKCLILYICWRKIKKKGTKELSSYLPAKNNIASKHTVLLERRF